MSADEVRVVKEMGITHKDFFRVLPGALSGLDYRVEASRVRVREDGGRQVEILLSEEGRRVLGGIVRMPVTMVELVFSGYSDEQRAEFLQVFDRQYFRGGG